MRALIAPVYAPAFLYAVGAAAIVPAQVLTGLRIGYSAAGLSLLVAWLGGCAVIGSMIAGYTIHAIGERAALGWAAGFGVAALVLLVGWLQTGLPAPRVAFAVALSVVEICDGLWSLARQSLIAERVDPAVRGRVLNTFGGVQRAGRVVGPLLASGLIAVGATVFAYLLHAALAVTAYLVVRRAVPPRAHQVAVGERDAHAKGGSPQRISQRRIWKPLLLVGLGVVALAIVRNDRDLLLPLWGVQGLHAPGSTIALVMGLCAAIELILFYPAGIVSDRFGRLPIVLVCLTTMAAGFVLLPLGHDVTTYVLGAVLIGLGNGVGAGIVMTLGGDLAPPAIRARYLGWWNAVANTGGLLAPAITSAVLVVGSLEAAVLVVAAIAAAGSAWMAYWMPRLLPSARGVRS